MLSQAAIEVVLVSIPFCVCQVGVGAALPRLPLFHRRRLHCLSVHYSYPFVSVVVVAAALASD